MLVFAAAVVLEGLSFDEIIVGRGMLTHGAHSDHRSGVEHDIEWEIVL